MKADPTAHNRWRLLTLGLIALGCAALACAHGGDFAPPSPTTPAAAAAQPTPPSQPHPGAALAVAYECNRCHNIDGLPAIPTQKHCVRCHQEILAGTFDAPQDALADWQARLTSLNEVPDLSAGTTALNPQWVQNLLLNPHKIRPRLPASMPRLQITPQDAATIADWLTHKTPTPPSQTPGQPQNGRRLLDQHGCTACHLFSGAPSPAPNAAALASLTPAAMVRGMTMAPDLRHTRQRRSEAWVAAWIQHPNPDSAMPSFDISPQDAADMAAWIIQTPLAELPKATIPQRLPLLERKVAYEELETKIFKKVCWHCHSDPDFADGDGGPGYTGGFGFVGRQISFADRFSTMAGGLTTEGNRRSLLHRLPDGTPWLVAALLARHAEEAGQTIPGLRGMPLGLPAIPIEDIQLLDTWIHSMPTP